MFNIILLAPAAAGAISVDRLRLDAIAAGSRMTGMGVALLQFKRLKQNRQYDVSCREVIRRNLFSADSTSKIVEKMGGFVCVSQFEKLVVGQVTPAGVIESVGRGGY